MTSLIPTVIALSSFFAENFPNISWYPYWYLGNPYHFLIGPVVPVLLRVIRVIGEIGGFGVALEGAYLLLILGSLVLGGFGLYLLLKDWGNLRSQAIVSGVLYIVLPAGFLLLNYQNGLNHIGFGFLPFALLLFREFLVKENKFLIVFLTLTITIMLLTSISILLPLVIGFIALFVSRGDNLGSRHSGKEVPDGTSASRISPSPHPLSLRERARVRVTSQNDGGSIDEKIGKIILIVFLGIFLSTLWYTPKFWWILTTNPSLGGVPFAKLVWSILQFLLQFLPLVFAIAVVKWRKFRPKGQSLFGLLFFTSFLFLSIVRFVSDPDFVTDWISFGLELQMGGAIILGSILNKFSIFNFQFSMKILNFKFQINNAKLFLAFMGLFLSIGISLLIVKDLLVSLRSNYQERVITILEKNVKEGERVFLSGSSVFFVNSKLNIQQVRGGVDQSSVHPFWTHGAYQIREGVGEGLAYDWLRALGVSYVLVHNKGSEEPFKDFKHPEKFSSPSGFVILACPESPSVIINREILESQASPDPQNDGCEDSGDLLYKVKDVSIGRVADSAILNVRKPKNGADKQAIYRYIDALKRPLAINLEKPDRISIEGNFREGEVGSMAVSYDSLWQISSGIGTIVSDPLGNIVVIPKKEGLQKFELVYKRSPLDLAITLGLSIIIVIILVNYHKIVPYVKKKIAKLHIGLQEEESY